MIAPLPFALLLFVGITISFMIGRRIGMRASERDPKGFA